jgi:hypothetical protein
LKSEIWEIQPRRAKPIVAALERNVIDVTLWKMFKYVSLIDGRKGGLAGAG